LRARENQVFYRDGLLFPFKILTPLAKLQIWRGLLADTYKPFFLQYSLSTGIYFKSLRLLASLQTEMEGSEAYNLTIPVKRRINLYIQELSTHPAFSFS
jgi:hypothetical protein